MKSKITIKKIFDFVSKIFSYLILAVLLVLCIFFLFYLIDNTIAKKTGKKPLVSLYVIVSPSMVPTINIYDVIIDTGVKSDDDLKVGDIVTFNSTVINTGGYTITHRINLIDNTNEEVRYITKGDNNKSVDVGFTTLKNIVGKVRVIIPKLGKIQKVLSSKWGWFIIVLIPSIGILLSDLVKLINLFRIKKDLIEIPDLSQRVHQQEIEDNKRLRVLMEKAEKLSEEKGDNDEEGESIK